MKGSKLGADSSWGRHDVLRGFAEFLEKNPNRWVAYPTPITYGSAHNIASRLNRRGTQKQKPPAALGHPGFRGRVRNNQLEVCFVRYSDR